MVSPFPSGDELRRGLAGVLPFFALDSSGLALLPRDGASALASFKVMTLALPAFPILLAEMLRDTAVEPLGPHLVLVWLLAYVLMWIAFPLLLLEFGRGKPIEPRLPQFILAANWLSLPDIYLRFLIAIMPFGLRELLIVLSGLYLLAVQWHLARSALAVGGWSAAALVGANIVVNWAIANVASSMTAAPAALPA